MATAPAGLAPGTMRRVTPPGALREPRPGPFAPLARAFNRLQAKGSHRSARALKDWAVDFKAYPDLRQVNSRYWEDGDVLAFIRGTLGSPNFRKIVRKYASRAEVARFVRDLLSDPEAAQGARLLAKDPGVAASASSFSVPGLPPLGALVRGGGRFDMGTYLRSQGLPGAAARGRPMGARPARLRR